MMPRHSSRTAAVSAHGSQLLSTREAAVTAQPTGPEGLQRSVREPTPGAFLAVYQMAKVYALNKLDQSGAI